MMFELLFAFIGFIVGGVTLFWFFWIYDRHEREEDREEKALKEFKKIRVELEAIRKEITKNEN